MSPFSKSVSGKWKSYVKGSPPEMASSTTFDNISFWECGTLSGMRKPIFVRHLLPAELEALHQGLRSSDALTMRRCQVLLASRNGQNVLEIARNLHCADQTVRNTIHDFNTEGLSALAARSSRPHYIKRAFDGDQIESLREMLRQSPGKYGKDTNLWTLELAAAVAHEQGFSATRVTGETIRATLERMGMGWRRSKQWITSPDSQYLLKRRDGTD